MAVAKANVENIYPLTPLQEGMLFHALLERTSPAYFQQLSWRLRGELDVAAFEASWNELVRRHATLRSAFVHEGTDRPLQVVLKDRPLTVTVVDLRDRLREPGGDADALVEAFKASERARPFDLGRDVLLRVAVLRLADDRYEIVWSHHHVVLDGWSIGLLLAELLEVYAAGRAGDRVAPPPVTPFARYVTWLSTRDHDASVAFWRAALAGYTGTTAVPATRQRAGDAPGERGTLVFALDVETTQRLRDLASRLGVTLNTVLQAAWAILLARYNDVSDVVFGCVVSGRSPEVQGIERMIGNFINTIPVRIDVRSDLTFAGLLEKIQRDASAAEPHHYVPLGRVQSGRRPHEGLFGTLLAFANYPVDARRGSPVEAVRHGFVLEGLTHFEQTHYPVDVQFLPVDGLRVRIGYARDLHDPAQIAAIEGHFGAVVAALLADEHAPIGSIDLLTGAERRQALAQAGGAGSTATLDGALAAAFEEQARRTPEAPAVIAGRVTLSYRELNARASRLAWHLRERHHVAPDERVGLVLGRGVEMLVGILGALKAGGCYVPLEPSLPAERLAYIVSDAGCRVLLADPTTLDVARGIAGVPVVDVASVPDAPSDDLPPVAAGRHLAYVIYTSGSTGRPKGVMIEQRSVVNLVQGLCEHVHDRYPGPLRVALIASYGFDASVQQIFGALLLGHALVVVDDATRRDAAALNALLLERAVDVIDGTPTLLALMCQADGFARVRVQVKHALIGGEPLPWSLVRRVCGDGGAMAISNVYGPTECCVDATAHLVDRVPAGVTGTVPIGRPLTGVRVIVVDATGHLAPAGGHGEICIAGPGLARGYLNDPERTEQKFVPSVLAAGERMYRSADEGRRLPDGTLECLGRLDDQVKVRGHRVELGEIEHHLRLHPAVAQAAVVVERAADGQDELSAYIVGAGAINVDEVRAHLGRSLPAYMIPSRFLGVDDLPRTVSGKLDRKALAAAGVGTALGLGSDFAPPASPVEERLAAVWRAVLGRERVGIDDNYFSLGGDSIKAIQILSRLLRDNLRVEMRDLFRHPTIRTLAPHAVVVTRAATATMKPASAGGDVPLTAIQARFFAEHTVEPERFNHAVLLHARGRLDADAVREAFARIVERHDSLRLTFHRRAGSPSGWVQRVAPAPESPPPLEVVDLRGDARARDALRARAGELQGGFDLGRGPLRRLALFRLDDGDRLLIVLHHLCVDGVSWRILFEELSGAYTAAEAGSGFDPPPATDPFAAWAVALDGYAACATVRAQAAYWLAVEARATPATSGERAMARGRHRDQERVRTRLSAADTAALLADANRAYTTTPEDLLLTALARTLHRAYGSAVTVIGLEGHGRVPVVPSLDVSRTTGWFTSAYPFALELDPARDVGYQIKSIKEALRAVPEQGIGYGLLRYVRPPAPGERLALRPWLGFNYLGRADAELGRELFRLDTQALPGAVSPDAECAVELDVSALVAGGRLELTVAYNRDRFAADAVRALVDDLHAQIRVAIDHCTGRAATELTPADLSYQGLSIDELEDMFS